MFSLIFLAGNIVFQLRFVVALTSSLACFVLTAAYMLTSSSLPAAALPFVLGLLAATAVFTLVARYQLERAERRAYLLVRYESTRSEVAMQAAGRYATLSQTDALTQLANRRAFDQVLPQRWQDAMQDGRPLAALLVDIDHFKRFNDRYGHPAGDACLRQVALLLREALREDDFIARIGGEEFAVLLRPGSEAVALQLAERMRRQVEAAAIPHDGQEGQEVVTISLGLGVTGPPQPLPPDALIAAADAALYRAKREGRNRCVKQGDALLQATPQD
jgi:diguanylate cyclase (GGDEF)-like protein